LVRHITVSEDVDNENSNSTISYENVWDYREETLRMLANSLSLWILFLSCSNYFVAEHHQDHPLWKPI